MSYDLAVFDPAVAPETRTEFVPWFLAQTKWTDARHDLKAPCATLAAWFRDMIATFPPMNGPLASKSEDARITDYSLSPSLIYAAFAWSQEVAANDLVRTLAAKHRLGFADVSADGFPIWLPSDGTLHAMRQ